MKLWRLVAMATVLIVLSRDSEAGRFRSRCRSICVSQSSVTQAPPVVAAESVTIATGVSKTVDVTRCSYGVCRSVEVNRFTSTSAGVSSLAQSKAEQMASRGQLVHLGGGFGGGSFEGIGFGATADQAVASCCGWGQRSPLEIGVASGRGGFYACVLYR